MQGRLSTDELHQIKWLIGQFLVLMAIWALYLLNAVDGFILLALFVLITVTILWPRLPGFIPKFFWRIATPLLLLLITLDFLLNRGEFLDSMVRMVMLLMTFRALQYRRRREDLQLVLLCLFILLIEGVLTLSIAFGFQIIIFAPLAMGLLFVVNLLERSFDRVLGCEEWARFSWAIFIQRIRLSLDKRLIGFSVLLFVGLAAVSSLIFVAMPRFRMDQALPFLQIEGKGLMGFSDEIRFGDVNELLENDRVALRVSAPDRGMVPTQPYWRMVVLDQYYDGVFRVSSSLRKSSFRMHMANFYFYDFGGRDEAIDSENEWVFYLEGNTSRYLPFLGPYDTIRFPRKIKFSPYRLTNILSLNTVPSKVLGYSVSDMKISSTIEALPAEIKKLAEFTGPIRLKNPKGTIGRIAYPATTLIIPSGSKDVAFLLSVVNEITNGEAIDVYEFTERAQQWLLDNYTYDIQFTETWDDTGDPLAQWMQKADRGWCEHFAGAFVLLCRTAGYPARSIAGFVGAEWNEYENYMLVRDRNAHAWAEVYNGDGEWFRVDPTPGSELGGGPTARAFGLGVGTITGWEAWTDSMRMLWYRRVVDFDEQDQFNFTSALRDLLLAEMNALGEDLKSSAADIANWLSRGWSIEKTLFLLLYAVLFLLLVCGAYFALKGLRYAYCRLTGKPTGAESQQAKTRRRAGLVLMRFEPIYQSTIDNTETQTTDWEQIHMALLALRYGPPSGLRDERKVFCCARRLMRKGNLR